MPNEPAADSGTRPADPAPAVHVDRSPGRHGRIDAYEALRISLVDEVVEPEQLLGRALIVAEHAASGSPAAIEVSKRAIRGALERPMAEAMQHGWELLLAHRAHPDSYEGPVAFAEKREPKWQ